MIKKTVKKEKLIKSPVIPSQPINLATISFHIKNDGSVNMSCNWTIEDEPLAILLGDLFFRINNGDYTKYSFETLKKSITKKNIGFIKAIMMTWEACESEYNRQPCISPIDALRGSLVSQEEPQSNTH